MDSGQEVDSVVSLVSECYLQKTKQVFSSRNTEQHATELT